MNVPNTLPRVPIRSNDLVGELEVTHQFVAVHHVLAVLEDF